MSSNLYQLKKEDGSWLFQRRALPGPVVSLAAVVEIEQRRSPASRAVLPIRIPHLIRKLGRTTYRLWCVLLTVRDDTAEAHPTTIGLSRMSGIGEAQVEKSLRRLRHFKLVEDYGEMYRHVPCRCADQDYHEHAVYVRAVYGEIFRHEEAGRFDARVPRESLPLLLAAAGQGGARKGAGRPRGLTSKAAVVEPNKSKVRAYKYQEPVSLQNLKVLQRNAEFHSASSLTNQEVLEGTMEATQRVRCEGFSCSEGTPPPPPPPAQGCAPITPAFKAQPVRDTASAPSGPVARPSPARRGPRSAAVAKGCAHVEATPASLAVRDTASPPAVAGEAPVLRLADGLEDDGLDFLWDGKDHQSMELRGGASRPQRFTVEDLQAATRVLEVIETTQVPAPPKVDPNASPEEQLRLLGLAYRAAHERMTGQDYFRPRKAMTDKEREGLLRAAMALAAEGISPAVWAKFSFQQWARMKKAGGGKAPAPRWVWSCRRITEHARWCIDEVGTLARQKTVPVRSNTELMRRLGRMQSLLGYGRPTEDVVAEVLPESERVELAEKARQERAAAIERLNQQIAQGEWVWG